MEVAKSHLDFSPRHGSGPCFRDLNYSPVDVNDTKSRRQHLTAYFKFMRPEVSHLFKEYAGRACRQACEMIYNREWKRPISPAYFDYFTDNLFWNLRCESGCPSIATVSNTSQSAHLASLVPSGRGVCQRSLRT